MHAYPGNQITVKCQGNMFSKSKSTFKIVFVAKHDYTFACNIHILKFSSQYG